MKRKITLPYGGFLFVIGFLALAGQEHASQVALTVDAGRAVPQIDKKIFGQFFEHIDHSANGGLWGNMIFSFVLSDGSSDIPQNNSLVSTWIVVVFVFGVVTLVILLGAYSKLKCAKCRKTISCTCNGCRLHHQWDGCLCTRCRKVRDKHRWDGCRCPHCGTLRDEGHVWVGCRCAQCGMTRNEQHPWEGCRCVRCGMTRDERHLWEGCRCVRCKAVRDKEHQWVQCQCAKCPAQSHEWVRGQDGCVICDRCRVCGKTQGPYADAHDWQEVNELEDDVECRRCGKYVRGDHWGI